MTGRIVGLLVFVMAWFALAGRLDWWRGWVFLGVFTLFSGLLFWRLYKVDPELARERNQPAEKAEPWDRAVMGVYSGVLLVLLVVCALDGGRFHWSPVPAWAQGVGWLLLVVTGSIVWHVMMVNAYLSSWARLQEERGQTVIRDGLYAHIRHPMYLGIILAFLGLPLALGSLWALIPGVIIMGLFVYRTYREDHMLQAGLPGYAEYAREVRYRLLPRIW
jgi:protein-S-isoprenylcysteine O-methyltransferase Ste14